MRVDDSPRTRVPTRPPSASVAASAARAARPPVAAPRASSPAAAARSPVASKVARCRSSSASPKLKGFNNPFRVEYSPVNLDRSPRSRRPSHPRGAGRPRPGPQGRLREGARPRRDHHRVHVTAHAVSKAAEAAITAAGGSVTLLPLPVPSRPAARRQGQPVHQPLILPSRSVVPTQPSRPLARSDLPRALEPEERLQGPRPAEQDPVHARDDRRLPAGRRHPGARHRPDRRPAAS